MRRLVLVAALGLMAVPVLAGGRLMQYRGLNHLQYNYATGEITWLDEAPSDRGLVQEWASVGPTGFFFGSNRNYVIVDWADINPAHDDITAFQIAYATSAVTADGVTNQRAYYTNDNGFGSAGRILSAAFLLDGLPGVPPVNNLSNGFGVGFTVDVFNFTPFRLDGPNLDEPNDLIDPDDFQNCLDTPGPGGFNDFSYTDWYIEYAGDLNNGTSGPIMATPAPDPNFPTCDGIGAQNLMDLYVEDPNNPVDPNDFGTPDVNTVLLGTFWFGGSPYAQFHTVLSSGDTNGAACPSPGCDTDVNADCIVDLSDLAILLANFGGPGTPADGDVEGPGGCGDSDGTVGLGDLSCMLAEFGNDCN